MPMWSIGTPHGRVSAEPVWTLTSPETLKFFDPPILCDRSLGLVSTTFIFGASNDGSIVRFATGHSQSHLRSPKLLGVVCHDLVVRGFVHDQSKLEEPEKSLFDQYTPKLAGMTYGSDDYVECLKQLQPALKHHYAANSHIRNTLTTASLV